MNIWKKRLIALFFVLALGLTFTACTVGQTEPNPSGESGEQTEPVDAVHTIYQQTGDLLSGTGTPGVGSVGGEWMVIGLARSGRLSDEMANAYIQAVNTYVASIGSDRLHKSKSTDNSRIILGLTAAGGDPTKVGGYNLLAGLNDMDFVTKQGNNGPIWALIALDCGNYEVPAVENADKQVTRERLVDYILSVQCTDGGWGLTSGASDIDVTAMALQALAAYREDEEVAEAIQTALSFLSDAQSEDGGYVAYGVSTSESCAQVIVALAALGIDPDTDSRFVKNGNSVLDALCSFAVDGGGFCHIIDSPEVNGVATEQGYYALTAYYRFVEGKSALYDMSE